MHLTWLDPVGGVCDGRRKTAVRITGEGVVKNEVPVVKELKEARNGSTRDQGGRCDNGLR